LWQQKAEALKPVLEIKDEKDDNDDDRPPTKTISTLVTIPLRCETMYIDLEGRVDSKSIVKILETKVKPHKLILIHGSDSAKEYLKDRCKAEIGELKDVMIPLTNQSVDITSETNIYKVNLKESLIQELVIRYLAPHKLLVSDVANLWLSFE
jgi:hypothetical protein